MRKSRSEFLVTTLGELELANALEVRVHRKEISRQQASGSWGMFEGDVSTGVWVVRSLTDQVFARALALSRHTTARLGTRTADLLHLAAALEFGCTALYSFDRQQRALARHMGLKLN